MSDERNRVARAIYDLSWMYDRTKPWTIAPEHEKRLCYEMADAALAEIGAVRAHQGYDPEMLNGLLDYIEQVEKTEHGMDGAVREIARRAAVIRGPVFRSHRTRAARIPSR